MLYKKHIVICDLYTSVVFINYTTRYDKRGKMKNRGLIGLSYRLRAAGPLK